MRLPVYSFRGAQALVIMHERYLREFIATWKMAKSSGVELPETDDPDYASMETLLRHVLRAARGYMTWICERLELPNPQIEPTPEADIILSRVDDTLEHLLVRWRKPLANVPEVRFFQPTYTSRWKIDYCIEAMLEHAVVHPMRHSLQLDELMKMSSYCHSCEGRNP